MPENLLKRIIAVSSNRGDCVLDPFSGSGTTLAAAKQLAKNYVGVEISKKYAENAKKRIAELEKQNDDNGNLKPMEMTELKRLVSETAIPIREITDNKNLLTLFTNQFTTRMNNGRCYKTEEIATVLRDSAD